MVEIYEYYQKPIMQFFIFSTKEIQKHKKCSYFHKFGRMWLVNELILNFFASIRLDSTYNSIESY